MAKPRRQVFSQQGSFYDREFYLVRDVKRCILPFGYLLEFAIKNGYLLESHG